MKKLNSKTSMLSRLIIILLLLVSQQSCTEDFDEINSNPNQPENAAISGILAGVQYFQFAEPRFLTWRGNLIYSSQFAHQFSYNVTSSWFGADAYQNNPGWTNAVFDSSYKKNALNLRNLLAQYTKKEDTNGMAVSNIMMSWFYQKMTDIYGDIPYSEVAVAEVFPNSYLPTYNRQKEIYRAILDNLKSQIRIIGDSDEELQGSEGDFLYNGDVQKWKAFANTLRLRMALRSREAFIRDGEETFINQVITDALSGTLIDETSQALLSRSAEPLELSNLDGGFEDIYWGFGETLGPKWVFTERYISLLRETNDPRLFEVADEAPNGGYQGSFIGARTLAERENLSTPSIKIIGTATTDVSNQVPIQVLSASEAYFLRAEAAQLGYAGDANALYQQGIITSMRYWGVDESDISNFIATEPVAGLSGDPNANLNNIWNQRWLASLTNGYESWALVRRTDLIPDLINNDQFFVTEPNNGKVPRRLPYSTTEKISNTQNVENAIQNQGPDEMSTRIWWDTE